MRRLNKEMNFERGFAWAYHYCGSSSGLDGMIIIFSEGADKEKQISARQQTGSSDQEDSLQVIERRVVRALETLRLVLLRYVHPEGLRSCLGQVEANGLHEKSRNEIWGSEV